LTKPKPSSKTPTTLFAALVIIAVLVGAYVLSQPTKPPANPGDIAPDFELPVVTAEGLTDQVVRLSTFRGKVVLLEFMVSWCHVCQEMAPSIHYLYGKYRGQDAVFLSVAGTQSGATADSTAAFIQQYDAKWTHVLDSDNSVFSRYAVEATPTYFVLDRSGKILGRFEGVVITDALSSVIDDALSS